MIVHRSNRTEALVERLAELVTVPPTDPFAAETIVVQGGGMARWLGLALAERLGDWANPAFLFPRALIDRLASAMLGEPPAAAAVFAPEALAWAVAAELPRQLGAPRFAPVRRFLADDRAGSKLLPLASRVANLFDQYAAFRPELVRRWEAGGGERDDWQPALWRALVARGGAVHPAARAEALRAALASDASPATPLPSRVSIFGLATLPPTYVAILAALARRVDVHLFILSPSREYWGDVASARERRRALAAAGADAPLYLEGPALLASLGRVGRDFQQILEERVDYQEDDRDLYREPGEATLLATLQSDLLALRVRGVDTPPVSLRRDDASIAVHSCHSPMREIEVLHDRLVALFAADSTLQPDDVIVMAPSIDAYAPLIEAVFTSPDRPRLPFTIADRRARATRDVVDAFLRALELLGGRLPASAVLDLLALEPVRARYAIAAEQLDTIRGWVERAGVRWGADADHRVAEGLPPADENTWRFGLDRLLLGTALPSAGGGLWRGTLPSGDLEGSDAELLGQLVAFVETLQRLRRSLASTHSPAAWRDLLRELLAAIAMPTGATADQHDAILAALATMAERATAGGFEAPIGLIAMRRVLEDALAADAAPFGFLTGAVTLCELVPMRTVPFRVVALVGLSDGVFPRVVRPLAFDLMARHPQPGDRTPRDDDRYLFLEALLSAREHLLITYVGRSITDNAELPPSVVVSELLDAIDAAARPSAGDPARRARALLIHQHPLQPFSPSAFPAAGPLRSFARSQFAGAQALRAPRQAAPPFLVGPLPSEPVAALDLEALVDFFANPSRWFLRQRLQLQLPRDDEAPDDREPIELDPLARWDVGQRLLTRLLAGGDSIAAGAEVRAAGILPLGEPGRAAARAQLADAAAIAAAMTRLGPPSLEPAEVELEVDGVRLTGRLRDRAAAGLLRAQFSRVGGRHELDLWIRHLVLNAARQPGATSVLVGRAKADGAAVVSFAPVADPLRHLATLLALFRRGQPRPLPFFERASRAFADVLARKRGTMKGAIGAAEKKFAGDEYGFGDRGDAAVRLLFPQPPEWGDPATSEAAAVATAVFGPLLRHREET